jgi:ferric-dicitrate binding protein FerR (iron transport regulator)
VAIEQNDIEDLIGKVLSGEATADEVREFETWRRASTENAKYFADMQLIFAKASTNQVKIDFDTDAAWTKVRSKIGKSKVVALPKTNWQPLRIAAGIVLIVAAGIFAWRSLGQQNVQTLALVSENKIVENTLPDSSTVTLNKKSSIEFKYDPKEKTRKVKLKGEGFFDVKHEETKPFVIETDETLVRDIGTSFNVRSYPDKDTIEVVVTSGVVQFYTLKDPGMMINAGETGIYSKRGKFFAKLPKADTNVLAYKTRVFSFHSTDLQSVIEQINEVYESHIKLANAEIAKCQLTATFRNDELEQMIEVITETFGLTAETNDRKEIILNGTGCQQP